MAKKRMFPVPDSNRFSLFSWFPVSFRLCVGGSNRNDFDLSGRAINPPYHRVSGEDRYLPVSSITSPFSKVSVSVWLSAESLDPNQEPLSFRKLQTLDIVVGCLAEPNLIWPRHR